MANIPSEQGKNIEQMLQSRAQELFVQGKTLVKKKIDDIEKSGSNERVIILRNKYHVQLTKLLGETLTTYAQWYAEATTLEGKFTVQFQPEVQQTPAPQARLQAKKNRQSQAESEPPFAAIRDERTAEEIALAMWNEVSEEVPRRPSETVSDVLVNDTAKVLPVFKKEEPNAKESPAKATPNAASDILKKMQRRTR